MNPVLDMEKRQELPVVGYYGMFELTNGFRKELYWPKGADGKTCKDIFKRICKRFKEKYILYILDKNFDAMAKKTFDRQLISKWGIMRRLEMQRAYEADMGVLDEDGTVRYVDNDSDIVAEVEAEISENSNKEEFVIESPAQIEEKAEPKTAADVVGQQKGKEPVKVEKKEQKQDIPAFMKMKNME